MDFKMSEVTEKENSLEFNIHGVDVSVVNSLRRVLLTRIETLVFRGFPYAQNKLEFIRNKTKFNNEYLKHRIVPRKTLAGMWSRNAVIST